MSESTVIWLEIHRILILCMNYILTCLVESHTMNPKIFVLESPDFSRGEYVKSKLQEAVVDVCNKKEEEIMDLERYVAEKEFLAAEKATTQVIKDFLKAGVPIKEVIKATKLSPEKVNELLEEIKEEHS